MKKKNPIAFLFKHRGRILDIIKDNNFNLDASWSELKINLPEINKEMNFKEFENYIVYVPLVDNETQRYRDEMKSLELELKRLKKDYDETVRKFDYANFKLNELSQEKKSLLKELNETRQELGERLKQGWIAAGIEQGIGLRGIPKNFEGWTVQFRYPYFRLYKKIRGNLISIHVGRHWDEIKAHEKIRGKLLELQAG